MKRVVARIKAACRTNDAQVTGVGMFTFLTAISMVNESIAAIIFGILFWPIIAFIINLIDPIPEPKEEK